MFSVISNCSYYAENILCFLSYHLQLLAKKFKTHIKDTNHFLKTRNELGSLPKGAFLCAIDIDNLYSNILHEEGLVLIRRQIGKGARYSSKNETLQ